MTLEDLLDQRGVVSVWQWSVPHAGRSFGTPTIRHAAGRTSPELAELGAIYMELLAHLANFEASLLDRRSAGLEFSPVEAIAFEGSRYSVVATGNRVAVVLDNRERPDFWELSESMSRTEDSPP
jgi:roadblock/LC7 domain-containing protein